MPPSTILGMEMKSTLGPVRQTEGCSIWAMVISNLLVELEWVVRSEKRCH